MSNGNCYRSRDSVRLPTITIIPEDLVEYIVYKSSSWFLCNTAKLPLRNCVLIALSCCIYLSRKTVPWRRFLNDPIGRNSILHYQTVHAPPSGNTVISFYHLSYYLLIRNMFLRWHILFQYFLDAIIRASAQNETVESCSGGSGGLIRLNASHVIHDFNV